MFNMNQVGRKIVTLRKENNMTQTELADKMGVSFQAVSNWERGNSMPDISKLPELAELFHISVDELLGEKSSLLNSAINHELKEYVEKNDVSREELEANIPILKPGQIEIIAENIDLTSGNRVEVFLPYLNAETVAALARKRVERGESAVSFLPFLEDDVLEELALLKEEYNLLGVVKRLAVAKKGLYDGRAAVEQAPESQIAQEYTAIAKMLIDGKEKREELYHE